MRQHIRPAKILLFLSEDEFPDKHKELPKRLLNYEKLGLEICFRPHNLMSHKKYYYALQEYPDHNVITVDDDAYYYPNTIAQLIDTHLKYPNCICANLVRIIRFDSNGSFMSYKKWERLYYPVKPSFDNVALGLSGILYPAGILKDTSIFDMEQIRSLAFRADDLWLRAHETINKIPVVNGNYIGYGVQFKQAKKVALMHYNCSNSPINGNDVQWKNLCRYYNLSKEDFIQ